MSMPETSRPRCGVASGSFGTATAAARSRARAPRGMRWRCMVSFRHGRRRTGDDFIMAKAARQEHPALSQTAKPQVARRGSIPPEEERLIALQRLGHLRGRLDHLAVEQVRAEFDHALGEAAGAGYGLDEVAGEEVMAARDQDERVLFFH